MPKLLLRIVAVILLPGLLVDTGTALCFSEISASYKYQAKSETFQQTSIQEQTLALGLPEAYTGTKPAIWVRERQGERYLPIPGRSNGIPHFAAKTILALLYAPLIPVGFSQEVRKIVPSQLGHYVHLSMIQIGAAPLYTKILIMIAGAIVGLIMYVYVSGGIKFHRQVPSLLLEASKATEKLAPVSVIIPCKGDDGRLLENLKTLVNQDYPADVEFILVTAQDPARPEDPAQKVFRQLQTDLSDHPEIHIKTVVAAISPIGSEKNNNIRQAVKESHQDSQVLVFLDSDGKSDPSLVRKLVSGLLNSDAAVVSGMRWYQPQGHRLQDLIRSAWNAGSYPLIANPTTTFIWGGAMAMRRETYEKAKISDLWAKSLADDAPLRDHLATQGMKTLFLPNCIVLSSEKDGWGTLFEFIARQTILLRFHHPKLFVGLSAMHIMGTFLGYGLITFGFMQEFQGAGLVAGVIGFLWIGHYLLVGSLINGPIARMLQASGLDVKVPSLWLVLIGPVTAFLIPWINMYCAIAKNVKWAGVTYTYDFNNGEARRVGTSS